MGIGLLPSHIAGADLQQGQLVPLLRKYQSRADAPIFLVYPPNRTLPTRVRVLIDFLVTRFEAPPLWEAGW